jgi:lipid-binding SYLF domain-containing protein
MKKVFLVFILMFSMLYAKSAEEQILEAANSLKKLSNIKNGVPKQILKEAKALIIIPSLHKAGMMVGVKYGEGIVSVRRDNGTWSYPFFVEIGGGSLGLQFGYENTTTLLIFRTKESIKGLQSEKFTLGAGASASAGTLGANYEKSAEGDFSSEIITYSQANGLFAGASLEGAVISNLKSKNSALYGSNINIKRILTEDNLNDSYSVQEFLRTINAITK